MERDTIIKYEKIKEANLKEAQAKRTKAAAEEDAPTKISTDKSIPFGAKVSSESMRDSVMMERESNEMVEKHFNTNLCEKRAEVKVIKK